ncbi:MAG: hypothetical protein ACRETA_08885 [Gammaproteobacteria bacterium]
MYCTLEVVEYFTLSWLPAAGAIEYGIEQSLNGGGYSLLPQTWSSSPAALSGYASGSYSFAVQGCGNAVCGNFSSPVSVSVLRIPAVPATPSLTPNPSTSGNYSVSWSAQTGASYYLLYDSTDGSNYTSTNVGNVTSQSETASSNGSYYYKVAACNASGCSAPSGVATETVALPVPGAPILSPNSQTIVSGGTAAFTWQPQGPAATSYTLQESVSGGWSTVYTGSATAFSQTLSGVAGVKYYRVQASNAVGSSPWSNTVSVTIQLNCGRHCNNAPAPGATTTPAPAAVSGGSVPGGLTFVNPIAPTPAAALHSSTRLAATTAVSGARVADASTQTSLRQHALRIEARRVARQHATARAAAPQPLYAALVETPQGRLISTQEAVAAGTELWGQVLKYQFLGELLGNGVINTYGFDPNTGALNTLQSGVGGSTSIAKMGYQWDADGNLHVRTDNNANLTETFTNDALNRLTQAQITGATSSTLMLGYDAVGDIQSKSDVGTYNYNDPIHPQQITSLTPNSGPVRNFSYDLNGNLSNDGVHSNSFDALNRPTQIVNSAANPAIPITLLCGFCFQSGGDNGLCPLGGLR